MSRNRRVELYVRGQVQGVFFRQGVKAEAERLALTGWVRNEDDGSVLIVAEGEEENLRKLAEWARLGTEWARPVRSKASGMPADAALPHRTSNGARVDDVKIEWAETRGELKSLR